MYALPFLFLHYWTFLTLVKEREGARNSSGIFLGLNLSELSEIVLGFTKAQLMLWFVIYWKLCSPVSSGFCSSLHVSPPCSANCQYLLAFLGESPPGRRKMSIRISVLKNNYSTSPSQQVHARAQVAPAFVHVPGSLTNKHTTIVCSSHTFAGKQVQNALQRVHSGAWLWGVRLEVVLMLK